MMLMCATKSEKILVAAINKTMSQKIIDKKQQILTVADVLSYFDVAITLR